MAALNEQRMHLKVITGLPDWQLDVILDHLSVLMWEWFEKNAEDEIVSIKTLFGLISVTVRVKHLRPFFERVFGAQPQVSS